MQTIDTNSMELISSTHRSKIYMGDRSVIKVSTKNTREYDFYRHFHESLEYVADVLSVDYDCPYHIIEKEILQDTLPEKENVLSLCRVWDEMNFTTAYRMFDYIEQFLSTGMHYDDIRKHKQFAEMLKILNGDLRKAFLELLAMIDELARHGLYNIDWHSNNFGIKNGHLALFELGEVKIK